MKICNWYGDGWWWFFENFNRSTAVPERYTSLFFLASLETAGHRLHTHTQSTQKNWWTSLLIILLLRTVSINFLRTILSVNIFFPEFFETSKASVYSNLWEAFSLILWKNQRALRSAGFYFLGSFLFLGCVGSVKLVNLRLTFQCNNNN